jgi:inosine/xanthosine triphosphate pyrophosphatase family protein
MKHIVLNTSNKGKENEFRRLFALYGISLEVKHKDLHEIDADHLTVCAHKASQLEENILVEDTSLEIEEACVGVNVRWLLESLSQYIGKKAVWRTLLAYQENGLIYIFEGKVTGVIVQSKGKGGFGFDPFFLPDNSTLTLAEDKPDSVNARAKAIEAFVERRLFSIVSPLINWEGPWQDPFQNHGNSGIAHEPE